MLLMELLPGVVVRNRKLIATPGPRRYKHPPNDVFVMFSITKAAPLLQKPSKYVIRNSRVKTIVVLLERQSRKIVAARYSIDLSRKSPRREPWAETNPAFAELGRRL
jgi:hypothetical protein